MGARLLRQRAERLAQQEEPGRLGEIDVVVFGLSGEQYAVDIRSLRGVQPVEGLTPIPCTPPVVAGILNLRGETLSVLDLASILGARSERGEGDGQVLIVETKQQRVGLLVDVILDLGKVIPDELDAPASAREFVVGVSDARTALLDLERLFSIDGFEIHEEVA